MCAVVTVNIKDKYVFFHKGLCHG